MHDRLHTIIAARRRRLFAVCDGNSTAYVWASSFEDAQHNCFVHDYLASEVERDWEISEVPKSHRNHATARAEADRRFDALHGRVTVAARELVRP